MVEIQYSDSIEIQTYSKDAKNELEAKQDKHTLRAFSTHNFSHAVTYDISQTHACAC